MSRGATACALLHAVCTGDLLFASSGKAPNHPNPQGSGTSFWIPGELCVGVISTCRPMARRKFLVIGPHRWSWSQRRCIQNSHLAASKIYRIDDEKPNLQMNLVPRSMRGDAEKDSRRRPARHRLIPSRKAGPRLRSTDDEADNPRPRPWESSWTLQGTWGSSFSTI